MPTRRPTYLATGPKLDLGQLPVGRAAPPRRRRRRKPGPPVEQGPRLSFTPKKNPQGGPNLSFRPKKAPLPCPKGKKTCNCATKKKKAALPKAKLKSYSAVEAKRKFRTPRKAPCNKCPGRARITF